MPSLAISLVTSLLATSSLGLTLIAVNKAEAGEAPLYLSYGTNEPDTGFQIIGPSDFQDLKAYAQAGQDSEAV